MGLDIAYQAVPHDWVQRVKEDTEISEWLALLPYHLEGRSKGRDLDYIARDALRYYEQIEFLLRMYPGIERRNIIHTRRQWDALHYLLSDARRQGLALGNDLGTRAVRGGNGLGAGITGAQGIPVRYSEPPDVLEVAIHLEGVTADDLREYFDPTQMEEQGVYKFQADSADRQPLDSLIAYFTDLRRLYREAATHHEGVLICVD